MIEVGMETLYTCKESSLKILGWYGDNNVPNKNP